MEKQGNICQIENNIQKQERKPTDISNDKTQSLESQLMLDQVANAINQCYETVINQSQKEIVEEEAKKNLGLSKKQSGESEESRQNTQSKQEQNSQNRQEIEYEEEIVEGKKVQNSQKNILDMEQFQQTLVQIQNFSKFANQQEKSMVIDNLIQKINQLASEFQNCQQSKLEIKQQKVLIQSQLQQKIKNQEEKLIELQKQNASLKAQSEQRKTSENHSQVIQNLEKKLKQSEQKYFNLLVLRDQDKKVMKDMENQIQVILKYANIQQRKTKKRLSCNNDKLSRNCSQFTLGTKQIQQLRQFVLKQKINQEDKQKLEQLQKKQSFRLSKVSSSESHEIEDGEGLDMISERTQQDGDELSSNFIKSKKNCESHISYAKFEKPESKVNVQQNNQTYRKQFEGFSASPIQSIYNSTTPLDYPQQDDQQQIDELKKVLCHRSSIKQWKQCQSNNSSLDQIECVQPLNQEQKKYIKEVRQQSMKRRITQNMRASNLLCRLDSARTVSGQYITQLEEEISSLKQKVIQLKDRLENQDKNQAEYQNQKVCQLLEKVQILEEQKIRYQSINEKLNQKLKQKQELVQQLDQIIKQRQEDRKRKSSEFKELRGSLNYEQEATNDLEDQLNSEYQQNTKLKSQIINLQTKNSNVTLQNINLKERVQENEEEIKQARTQLRELNQELKQSQEKQRAATQKVLQMQVQYENYLRQLQAKDQDQQRQIVKLKNKIGDYERKIYELQEQKQSLCRKLHKHADESQKYRYDISVLQKTIQDLKYLNQILKKDAFAIQIIQKTNWNEVIDSQANSGPQKENRKKKLSIYSSTQGYKGKNASQIFKNTEKKYGEKQKKQCYGASMKMSQLFEMPRQSHHGNGTLKNHSFTSSTARKSFAYDPKSNQSGSINGKMSMSALWSSKTKGESFEIAPKREKHHSFYASTYQKSQTMPITEIVKKKYMM